MNRPFEFRAWNNQAIGAMTSSFELGEDMPLLDGCTILQYTGLTDRNYVKIFEGDILEDGDVHAVVEWDRSLSRFYSATPTQRAWVNCRVIGNVYENPELAPEFTHDER